MIYPDVTVEEWIRKYPSLRVLETKAHPCGCRLKTDRPFLSKDYAGLESRKCCDKALTNSCSMVPISKEEIAEWDAVMGVYIGEEDDDE